MNKLSHMINRAAFYYGDRVALVCNEKKLTFSEVNINSNKIAKGLMRIGVKKGERVAVLLPNCSEYVETDFALIKGGFVRLPINPRLKPTEYNYILNDAEAVAIVFGSEYLDDIKRIKEEIKTVKYFVMVGKEKPNFAYLYENFLNENGDDFIVDVVDDDAYQLLYTSGTTGNPKGALTNFKSRLSTLSTVLIDEMKVTKKSVLLTVAPIAHGGGTKILPHYIRGAKNVLLEHFSLQNFCETVEREKVTTTWMVPAMISMLLEYQDLESYDLSSLETVVYAAAPMPEATLRRAIDRFGNIFVQVYGLSEAPNPVLLLDKEDHIINGSEKEIRRLQSAGREAYGVHVRVVDKKGKDVSPGENGEIIVSGDNIMVKYWKLPEATAETIKNGWLYTGDIATVDEEGYVYIVDRRKDMIISGGFNIYPREIEEILYKHPAVYEAAVIGVPDDRWGEAVKAVISIRPGMEVSEIQLIEFCEEYLAKYKKIRTVEFLDQLPKGPNGKILKREIREKFWQGKSRKVN